MTQQESPRRPALLPRIASISSCRAAFYGENSLSARGRGEVDAPQGPPQANVQEEQGRKKASTYPNGSKGARKHHIVKQAQNTREIRQCVTLAL